MDKKKFKLYRCSVAIICITVLEIFAIRNGVDGYVFALVLAIIGGLAGYELNPKLGNLPLKNTNLGESEK